MRTIILERDLQATRTDVWAILADYPNISSWNSGVKASRSTSEAAEGVGATRHCDLTVGGVDETIRHWNPESKLVISIDSASKLPIKSALASFDLTDHGKTTPIKVTYDFEPGGGPFAFILGPILAGQLKKGFEGFLDDLEAAASAK